MPASLMDMAIGRDYDGIRRTYRTADLGDVAKVADYLRDEDCYLAAIELYRHVLEHQESPDLHFGLGQCLGKSYDYPGALAELRLAFPPGTDRTDGAHYFAYILERNELWPEAGDWYERALTTAYADDLWARSHHAWYLEKAGSTAEAEAAYRSVLETNPAYTWAVKRLAVFLLRAGRAEEAEALMADAEARQPNSPFVLLNRLEFLLVRERDEAYTEARGEVDVTSLPPWAQVVIALFDLFSTVLIPGVPDEAKTRAFEERASQLADSVHRDFDDLTERLADAGGDVGEWKRLINLLLR